MSRRITTRDERVLFETVIAEARPIKAITAKAEAKAESGKSKAQINVGGLDGNTQTKLRRGQLDPDARIDLHGHTEAGAHDTLLAFLRRGQKQGAKLVLVITGKSAPRDEHAPYEMGLDRKPRGILNAVVPRWLNEPAFAALIAGTGAAHRRHGGSGALYVYLRRSR